MRTGKRLVLRKVDFKLFNRSILRVPYLSIPLEDRNDRYLPEVGQSHDEGYYVKSKFGIPLAGTSCVEMQLVAVPACLVALGVTFCAPVAGRG